VRRERGGRRKNGHNIVPAYINDIAAVLIYNIRD